MWDYQQVSNIQDIMPFLGSWEKDFLSSNQDSHSTVSTVLAVNAILEVTGLYISTLLLQFVVPVGDRFQT